MGPFAGILVQTSKIDFTMIRHHFTRRIIPYNPNLIQRAKRLRRRMTYAEVILWSELKGNQLGVDFDRQRPIDEYIVDFYCKDLMLAIEVDGESHDSEETKRKDARRQARLESLGVRFLRFSNSRVEDQTKDVIQEFKEWSHAHADGLPGREKKAAAMK